MYAIISELEMHHLAKFSDVILSFIARAGFKIKRTIWTSKLGKGL